MTTPENRRTDPPEDDAGPPVRRPRRVAAAASLAAVVVVAAAVVAVVVFGRSTGTSAAAPATPTATSSPRPSVTSSLPAADRTSVLPQPTVIPGKEKYVPPPMTDAQLAATRTELAALAPRLPHLALTAPATWAQYAGSTPDYDQDIVSCPRIADRLAADLGNRWTYTFGKLPTSPYGCNWSPVPWVPDVTTNFVSIGYGTGTVADLTRGMESCSGGVDAPSLDVPQVGRGARLYGCDDVNGPGYDLAVPDTGGSGVFFLHSTGGPKTSAAQAANELLAVIDGATLNYG